MGALLQSWAPSVILTVVFGGLMVFAGISNLLGWPDKLDIKGWWRGVVGVLSGLFGGLVGNQGGLGVVGLVGFKLTKTQFVATATAVALAVDVFRVPVYVAAKGTELERLIPEIVIMSAGVVIGTLLGAPLLRRLPERYFKVVLSVVLIVAGILVVARP